MALISTVVGHTTATTTRILAIFEGGPGSTARIACRDGSGVEHFMDAAILPTPPYGIATFQLTGLNGPKVTYSVAQFAVGSAPPDPSTMLAGPNAKTFRLIAPGPLRIGLVSCNDIDNHKSPKEQRGALWRRLGSLVAQGQVDLLVHAGDQSTAMARPSLGLRKRGGPPPIEDTTFRLGSIRMSRPSSADARAS